MQQNTAVEIIDRVVLPWPAWLPEGRSAVFQSVDVAVEIGGSPSWLVYSEADLPPGTDLEAVVATDLDAATAGTHIRITGSEAFVARVLSAVHAEGAIDEEIVATVTDPASGSPTAVRFFCILCVATYSAEAAIGDVVRCPGCGTPLLITHRFSSHLGAFHAGPTGGQH
jgi:DNA-directed RNA polymerase subunit RPC12/RpoP